VKDKITKLAKEYFDDIVACRRHLHANPELSFNEHKTAQFIADKLSDYGIKHTTGIAETGVVGIIEGKNPNKKVIALRADIDALPIQEKNDVAYKSQNDGVMHACGHDVHTASLLGTCRILNELKEEFEGTIKLIFQPGEEKFPGGASLLIKAGVLKKPDVELIIGQHVMPDMEVGNVGFCAGPSMASADEIYMTVKGKGGHAAIPHKNVDSVLITAQIITALQQIVSRRANPATPSVLSFGKVIAMGATNIIPNEVKIEGTFRTFDEFWRKEAHGLIKEMAENIAKSYGGNVDVDIRVGYPSLDCDYDLTARCKQYAINYLDINHVVDTPIRMGGEDFAFYSKEIPACFYRLGVGNAKKGINSGLHTPTFNIDDGALKIGTGLMAYLAIKELQV